MKKLITIPHNGPIYGRGGVLGPITTPFLEDVSNIATILIKGAPVVEHLEDGTKVELTLNNYNKDNTPKVEDPTPAQQPKQVQKPEQQQPQQQQKPQQQQQNGKNPDKTQVVVADEITKK